MCDVDVAVGTLRHPRRRAEGERLVGLGRQYTDVVRYGVRYDLPPGVAAMAGHVTTADRKYGVVPGGDVTSPGEYDVIVGQPQPGHVVHAQKLRHVTIGSGSVLRDVDAHARSLEVCGGDADVEPQLVGEKRAAPPEMTAKLTSRTREDRL